MVLVESDLGMVACLLQQGPFDLPPRHIGRVHDAITGMAAFATQIEGTRPLVVTTEGDTVIDQIANPRRPLTHHQFNHLPAAEAGPGGQGILDMECE